jgi:hypothetical protein
MARSDGPDVRCAPGWWVHSEQVATSSIRKRFRTLSTPRTRSNGSPLLVSIGPITTKAHGAAGQAFGEFDARSGSTMSTRDEPTIVKMTTAITMKRQPIQPVNWLTTYGQTMSPEIRRPPALCQIPIVSSIVIIGSLGTISIEHVARVVGTQFHTNTPLLPAASCPSIFARMSAARCPAVRHPSPVPPVIPASPPMIGLPRDAA